MGLGHLVKIYVSTFIVAVTFHVSARAAEPDIVPLIFINNLPFVSVAIGNASTRLLIDSGGSLGLSIPETTIAKAGSVTLLKQKTKFSDLSGKVFEVQNLVADRVIVGTTHLGPVNGRIHTQWGGAPEGPEAGLTKARQEGAIGLEAFGKRPVMLDYQRRTLLIYAPGEVPQVNTSEWKTLRLDSGTEGPYVTLVVSGKSLKFVLDTGSPVNLVNRDSLGSASSQLGCAGPASRREDCNPRGLSDVRDTSGQLLGALKFEQIDLKGAPFDGILGAVFFAEHRVLFDLQGHRLFVAPAPVNNFIDSEARVQITSALIKEMNTTYIFPEIAKTTGQLLLDKQKSGAYEGLTQPEKFASVLTTDLQNGSHDRHFRVFYSEQPIPDQHEVNQPSKVEEAVMAERAKSQNYGIHSIEHLPGNIGYLALNAFVTVKYSRKAIAAAMTALASSDALIIDMRKNGGGDPHTVAFLASYLFDKRTHLNDFHLRKGSGIMEFWTEEMVPGTKYGQNKDVFVLTSRRTFSGGEELSYDLKNLKRAILVGEATGGGANPGGIKKISEHFAAFVPDGRPINPITKTNWEGTGVIPDVIVPVQDALLVAQRLALKKLISLEKKPTRAKFLNEELAKVLEQQGMTTSMFSKQTIYLRGSMNDWGVTDLFKNRDGTTYEVDIALVEGEYEFKVGSKDFEAIDFGAATPLTGMNVRLNTQVPLAEVGDNLSIIVSTAATFRFSLDVKNPYEPSLTVTIVK